MPEALSPQGQATLPFSILLLAVVLLGVETRCLSHTVILAAELVFAPFLISALSLDLSYCPNVTILALVSMGDSMENPQPTTQFTTQEMGNSQDSELPREPPDPSTKHGHKVPSPPGPPVLP